MRDLSEATFGFEVFSYR